MTFEKIIDRVLSHEGGLVDNPQDPGGLTQWGISQRSYPNLDIRALTREQAVALYKKDFYDPINIDSLPEGVAYQLMDCAVNSGVGTAIRMLQRAIGVADDGHIGPVSKEAIEELQAHDLIMRFLAERLEFMTKLKNWPNASRGWSRRIAQNLRYGADDV